MNPIYEYCRFKTAPRALHSAPAAARERLAERARASGGKLFGCWRSVVGLGLARDEGIAVTSWASVAAAKAATPVADAECTLLKATVRPLTDAAPTYEGVYVFRWFDVAEAEWQDFCLSDGLTCDKMLAGADLGAFHSDQYAAHEKLIAEVGAAAITGE